MKKKIWRKVCKFDENYKSTDIRSSTNPSRINLKETTLQKNHIQTANSNKQKILKAVKGEKIAGVVILGVRQSRL